MLVKLKNIPKEPTIRILAECFITVVLFVISCKFYKLYKGLVKRGFFCDDESLKYPYHEDSVSVTLLLTLSLYVPITVMVFCEIVLFLVGRRRCTTVQDKGFARAFLKLHHNITPFVCGFALHTLFMHVAKITLGRLRPHFFEVCQPYRTSDDTTCDSPKNHGLYIEDYECSNPYSTRYMLYNVHLSFPSGHSGSIFYGMIFIILYLQRFSKTLSQCRINIGLFMMVAQMLCALLAWFVALSRVMDYKHHWSDVLVGIMLGTSVAIAVTLYVCQQLKSVNDLHEGVNSSNSETTSTTTFTATTANSILVK
ncbi:putative phosphatidate phosphatase [Calliphora vicina]|uniref:putative phosphatidate phosphatase n=1 Tax=Calliphora vicina TaxID=7373 RepID=UPI00325AEC52